MSKWIGPVLGGVALAVGLVNLVMLQGVSGRLDELAERPAVAAQPVVEADRRPRRPRLGRDRDRRVVDEGGAERRRGPGLSAAVDLDDPVVVEELTARLADRLEAREMSDREVRHQTFVDEAAEEVRRFADERDWSDETTEQVIVEVQTRMDAWGSVKQDVRDGAVSRFEARREMDVLREESDAKMLSWMSQEDLDALSETVFGGPPKGGRGRR